MFGKVQSKSFQQDTGLIITSSEASRRVCGLPSPRHVSYNLLWLVQLSDDSSYFFWKHHTSGVTSVVFSKRNNNRSTFPTKTFPSVSTLPEASSGVQKEKQEPELSLKRKHGDRGASNALLWWQHQGDWFLNVFLFVRVFPFLGNLFWTLFSEKRASDLVPDITRETKRFFRTFSLW